jgi:hypothetical protein
VSSREKARDAALIREVCHVDPLEHRMWPFLDDCVVRFGLDGLRLEAVYPG